VLQANPHAPPLHVAAALATAGHAVQEPQWLGSVCSLTQNPLHSEKVALQANVHAWEVHVGLALATPVVQDVQAAAVPHAVGLVPGTQAPALQHPLPQDVPQPPQLFGSVCSLTQAPPHIE
jgi:hypothetical protein